MVQQAEGVTLTQVAYVSRQTVKFGLIFLVLFMVGRTFLSAFSAYWIATHPAPPPPPTVGFGLLPPLKFPARTQAEKPTSYQMETASGSWPSFGDRAKVFLMTKSVASLLDDEKAKAIAASFDFVFTPEVISSEVYRFAKTQPLSSTLELQIRTHDFTLTTDYLSHPELLTAKNVPDQSTAIEEVKSALSSAELLGKDLATSSGETVYLKALGTQLTPALSFSDADFAQVDLYRTPIDNQFRFYTPAGNKANIHAIVTGAGTQRLVELNYHYQQIDYTQVHTYPLRSVQTAWKLLQSNEGFVATKGTADAAIVRKVSLGYYDDAQEQEYLQPIYVFEGDGGFIGYVSAIDPTYVQGNGGK
jgi:hypothetical protein